MKRLFIGVLLFQFGLTVFSQDYVYQNLNNGKNLVDVSIYRSDRPEDIIFNIPNNIRNGILTEPLNYIDRLVEYLISWTDKYYLKINSIHDWIVCNISYDVVAYNRGEIKIEQPHITLRYRTAVCGGYSMLFNYMADKAGFEVTYISGVTKGRSKYTIQPLGQFVRHAWNGIKINDIYYLIDTTWNAGYVNNNKFIFAYTTDFFLTDPNEFLKRHYPQAHGWLLTDDYVSIDDFRNIEM
jgi:transglutaminase/protease-like cytokinesis protein 3